MSKVRVPLHGKPQGYATLDTAATRGATVGVDLRWSDGVPVSEQALAAAMQAGATPPGESGATYWRTIMEIPPNVTALADTTTTGLYAVTAAGESVTREITSTTLAIGNGAGVGGNPSVNLDALADAGGGTLLAINRDQYGRVAGTSAVTTDDLPEGDDNLYFTDDRADARVGAGIDDHEAAPDPHPQYVLVDQLAALPDAVDDAAADAAGVAVGNMYRTDSTLKVRIS